MEMRTQPRPPWADEYLRFAAWTHDEFRNLLCGLPPQTLHEAFVPAAAPAGQEVNDAFVRAELSRRKEFNDAFVRAELRRVATDRHVRDAILVGDLEVLEPPDERLLEKIKPHLTPEEFQALNRAIAHDRSCSKAYRVARDAAVCWAAARRDLFPDFPFTVEDLQSGSSPLSSAAVSPELKEHRALLFRRARKRLGFATQAAFCREHNEFTPDILRGIVNSDSNRVNVAKWTPQLLELLGIAEEEWNTP